MSKFNLQILKSKNIKFTNILSLLILLSYVANNNCETVSSSIKLADQVISNIFQEPGKSVALPSDSQAGHDLDNNCPATVITRGTNPWPVIQAKIQNSVVQIFSQVAEFNWLQPYATPAQGIGTGSGFFINDQGVLITNAHVVSQAKVITCQIPALGKEQFELEVIGISFDRDIALLRLKDYETVSNLLGGAIPFLELGDSEAMLRGEEIMAVGFPLGQQSLKTTVGVISGYYSENGRYYIQIDAAINPGNSGGPSVNGMGQVIGINSAIIPDAQNVGYIIPVRELQMVLKDLYEAPNRLLRRPYLGVFYTAAGKEMAEYLGNPTTGGCLVYDIAKGSLCDKVGLKPYDMIYEVNGQKLDAYAEISMPQKADKISLSDYMSYVTLGSEVSLVIYRNGERKEFKFKFDVGTLPAVRSMYPDYEKIEFEVFGGFVIMPLSQNHLPLLAARETGLIKFLKPLDQIDPVLVISHILPGSAAQSSRLFAPGKCIKELNGVEVSTMAEFRAALKKSLVTGIVTLKTDNDVFSVFSLPKILQNEPRLAGTYNYQISETVRELIQIFDPKKVVPAKPVKAKSKK